MDDCHFSYKQKLLKHHGSAHLIFCHVGTKVLVGIMDIVKGRGGGGVIS
jgi:hypothetical protein